jgi:homoserine O-acetyltransferase
MVNTFNTFVFQMIIILFYPRAHSVEGPEPAYHEVVSGYEIYKHQNGPFRLKYNNRSLNQFQIAYETWGKLNEKKNNAILIFTGLSASSHAKSHEVSD